MSNDASIAISRDQLRLLSNPTRLEIYSSLSADGQATARELATRMGGDEMTLYYHLRLLARMGLISGSARPTATKPEQVFSVRGRLVVDLDLGDDQNLSAVIRNLESLFKAAARDCRAAAEERRSSFHEGSMIGRQAVRLTPEKFEQLRQRLRELGEWVQGCASEDGDRYSLTFAAVRLAPRAGIPRD